MQIATCSLRILVPCTPGVLLRAQVRSSGFAPFDSDQNTDDVGVRNRLRAIEKRESRTGSYGYS